MNSYYYHKILACLFACISLCCFQFCGDNENTVNDQPPVADPDTNHVVIETDTAFLPGVPQGLIENEDLSEASGLVVSRSNPDLIWSHNDSGDQTRLFLVGSKGDDRGVFKLTGIKNRDWEDIAIGPGPEDGKTYIYIGDIGDNVAQYREKTIYRMIEPDVSSVDEKITGEITGIETIRFEFPDGIRDAETLMLDPLSKDLYIISKREPKVGIYLLEYPYSTTESNLLKKVGAMNLSNVVGGDISAKGNEVLIKTYSAIYYWEKKGDKDIVSLLQTEPVRLPYFREPQGEALGWKVDGSGFYTVSEEPQGIEANLFFYMRL